MLVLGNSYETGRIYSHNMQYVVLRGQLDTAQPFPKELVLFYNRKAVCLVLTFQLRSN